MKTFDSIATTAGLILLVGCASAPTVARLGPVGPSPANVATDSDLGSLQVYSACEKSGDRPELIQWEWDYPWNRSAFTHGVAHTDYIIRTAEGTTLQYVRNASTFSDPTPAVVSLPPGHYNLEADAEDADGRTAPVLLQVLIEPGKTTVAHLTGNWQPRRPFTDNEIVRLPDGQIAGWLAAH